MKEIENNDLLQVKNRLNRVLITTTKNEEKINRNENVFSILKIDDLEIRHSNFLAWLLSNNYDFLYEFLNSKNICCYDESDSQKLSGSRYSVYREYKNKKDLNNKSLDIVIVFQEYKKLIVIENKIYSSEGETQLKDYYELIENNEEFHGYQKLYFYLTLNGELPCHDYDKIHWKSISYKDILDILKKLKLGSKNVVEQILVKNYIEILKEKIEMPQDRVKEYFEIYKNNKEVVTEMATYIPNIKARASMERKYLSSVPKLRIQSNKQNIFISFSNNDVVDYFRLHNLPDNWVEFCLSNEPFNKCIFYLIIYKDQNDKYIKFSSDFRKTFKTEDKSKNSSYMHLMSETIISNPENKIYMTEEEFQSEIINRLNTLITDKNSSYNKIVDFIMNYNLD